MGIRTWFLRKIFGSKPPRTAPLTPAGICRLDNIQYGPTPCWNLMDIYYHEGEDASPILINVHGGGWISGSKETAEEYCLHMATYGFTVVNFSYRIAPKWKLPAPLEDTCMVINWLREHASEVHGDMERVYMVGDSAGAHILALLLCALTNGDYAECLRLPVPKDFLPKAVALNCGVYDMQMCLDDPRMGRLNEMVLKEVLGNRYTQEAFQAISPIGFLNEKWPPVYLMSSNGDFLLGQVPVLEGKLKELGITHKVKVYGDDEQPLIHVFHCNVATDAAKKANQEEAEFLLSCK